jgi:hypothetical protein
VRLGLARAGNRGRRLAGGEFVALLHDDSEIDAGWLEALLAAADAHPEAGAFGGFVAFPDGAPQTAGVTLFRDGAALPPWPARPPASGSGPARATDFCASNALLVRAAAWDAAGGLDTRYFPAYFVDADLAMALRAAGWSVLFVPAATSRHRRGSSSRRDFREWVSGRNRGLFVEKWKDALADYEPWDGGSAVSFGRALDGAATRAARLAEGPRRKGTPPAGAAEDSANDFRALEQEAAVRRAWADHLESTLDARNAAAARDLDEVKATSAAALREAEARREALESLVWWRLYVRLLPVLRPIRAAMGRLSRRGAPSRTG